jgi:hypothetical protein
MVLESRLPFTRTLRSSGAGFSVAPGPCGAPRTRPRRIGACAALATALALLLFAAAASGARDPLEVPLHRISREHRTEVRSIIEGATLVRRLPARAFRAEERTYIYLLDNLPLSSRLADLLDFGRYRVVEMEGGRLHGWDFSGIKGDFWLVHSSPRSRIYRGVGSYDSWLTPKITGRVLLVVGFRNIPAADAGSEPGVMETTLDVYVSTNRLVSYLMEIMGRVADTKLSQLITSAQLTSERLSEDPRAVLRKMESSSLFSPEEMESLRGAVTPVR